MSKCKLPAPSPPPEPEESISLDGTKHDKNGQDLPPDVPPEPLTETSKDTAFGLAAAMSSCKIPSHANVRVSYFVPVNLRSIDAFDPDDDPLVLTHVCQTLVDDEPSRHNQ
ncbi:hypothetical protein PM082_018409 [Marasmius tenuissimus]|nr:hypothetical protein PM082_018409 [Marasmius tenuissimus]